MERYRHIVIALVSPAHGKVVISAAQTKRVQCPVGICFGDMKSMSECWRSIVSGR